MHSLTTRGFILQIVKDSDEKLKDFIEENKLNMLKMENEAALGNNRVRTLKQIFTQLISYFKLDSVKQVMSMKVAYATAKDYLFGSRWLQNILMAAEYIYNSVFNGNILVPGKTNARETIFVQKLGMNNFLES